MNKAYIITDKPEFYNDISEEMRLFIDITDIEMGASDNFPSEGELELSVFLVRNGENWLAEARVRAFIGGELRYAEYTHSQKAIDDTPLLEKRYMKRCIKVAVFRAMKKLFPTYVPWGSLTGIRPTRLLRELYETETVTSADELMLNEFDVRPEKLALAKEINEVQKPFIDSVRENDIDIYIGIPYCRTKCLYCSFSSCVRGPKTDMSAYIDALKRDIRYGAELIRESGRSVRSMYIGGGTPTVLTASELDEVISYALESYGGCGAEFTVEAGRPDTIDGEKLRLLKKFGVSRISINPQTMNDRTLEIIGRMHSVSDIVKTYDLAREIGFDSINMDVIAGLMGEDLACMQRTMDEIAKLEPDNLTVHTLAVKRSSRLKEHLDEYMLLSADEVDKMVNVGMQVARDMGMRPYYMYRQKYMSGNLENVGYAKANKVCMYNIDMMEETTSIMAHGAGAMSKCVFPSEQRLERIANPKDIATYIDKIDLTASKKRELFVCGAKRI